jgi:S-adenosylhomocysteine hydrolase
MVVVGRVRHASPADDPVVQARIDEAISEWDSSRSSYPSGPLPLLDLVREQRPSEPAGDLILLCIQHHLPTTVPLVKAFLDDGLRVHHVWHADIPYSTNLDAHDQLRGQLGHPERTTPLMTDPLADYTVAQLLRVSMLLVALEAKRDAPSPSRRLLVLDDGAYFLRAVLALRTAGHPAWRAFRGARVVEQTTRGHRFLETHQRELTQLGMRVVSVARTTTKVRFEGPFIGGAVSRSISEHAKARGLMPRKIAIIGYGVVGQATVAELGRVFPDADFLIVETRREMNESAARDAPHARVLASVTEGDGYELVVGCTGRNSFTIADRHVLADRSLLASGSSAALEFDRAGFVELADAFEGDEIEVIDREGTQRDGIHADVTIAFEGGKQATFLNAGFPVNFDGRRDLPVQMIQPTRCLMYLAAQQVMTHDSAPGFVELDRDADEWLFALAMEQL